MARKVAIRTAVSRPTSPRKAKAAPAAEPQTASTPDGELEARVATIPERGSAAEGSPDAETTSGDGSDTAVPTVSETDLAATFASAILSLELMQGGADPEARTALGDHCTRLWKALRAPAILEDGRPFDDKTYLGLLAAANAPPEASDWLATMPESENLPDFFARRPGAAD